LNLYCSSSISFMVGLMLASTLAAAFSPSHFAVRAPVLAAQLSPPPNFHHQRHSHVVQLLSLGDDPNFDPFADSYPPAVVEEKKTCVRLVTTAGDCHIVVDRAYSPGGVDRFLELVESGFFTDMLLYRVLPGFLVQFGSAADPSLQARWQDSKIPDEPNRVTFRGGTLSYAGNGVDSRTCHLFVALSPYGAECGKAHHETTIGHVQEVEVFEKVAANFEASGYPDLGGLQGDIVQRGNEAAAEYPNLDRILRAEVIG